MPNWVSSVCTVKGPAEDIEKFRTEYFSGKDEDDCFQFDKIIPMQPILQRVISPVRFGENERIMLQKDDGGPLGSHIEATEEEHSDWLAASAQSGASSWYEWATANWGTKWGAVRVTRLEADSDQFRFETAWGFPHPIFRKLAELHPTLTFDCRCFDEGWNFAGAGQFGADVEIPFNTFAAGPQTNKIYEAVYGHPPAEDDDD